MTLQPANATGGIAGALTVFIAERQALIREALAVSLDGRRGLQVVGESGDGNRVLDTCLRDRPNLLLLSTQLVGLGGVEICRALSAAAIGVNVLVVISGDDDQQVLRHVEAGALGGVDTCEGFGTLLQAVEVVGRGKAFFGERMTRLMRDALQNGGLRSREGDLSVREAEILRLIAEGFSNKEIAAQLGICAKTVENHRSHLMRKLRAHNSADLTREAFRLGVVKTAHPFPVLTVAGNG